MENKKTLEDASILFRDLSLRDGLTFELKNDDELRDVAISLLQYVLYTV